METILKIEIGKINSKKFEKALNIMKSFPHYESEIQNRKEIHKCYIKDTIEYINNYTKVEPLISLVRNWKSASIYLNDKKMGKYLIYFRDFQYEMAREKNRDPLFLAHVFEQIQYFQFAFRIQTVRRFI